MEYINRIEIQGYVGEAEVIPVGDSRCARLSVLTEHVLSVSDSGEAIVETAWHNVTAWESERTAEAFTVKRGDTVKVTGRLRLQRYGTGEGSLRTAVEIVANSVEIITEG